MMAAAETALLILFLVAVAAGGPLWSRVEADGAVLAYDPQHRVWSVTLDGVTASLDAGDHLLSTGEFNQLGRRLGCSRDVAVENERMHSALRALAACVRGGKGKP